MFAVDGGDMSSVFRRENSAFGTVIRRFFQKSNYGIQVTGMRETSIPRADDQPCSRRYVLAIFVQYACRTLPRKYIVVTSFIN